MIAEFLSNSRALLKKPTDSFNYPHFNDYLSFAKAKYPQLITPTIKIVYSLNKDCETFTYQRETFIIYDRYLGQVFNKFNRLIYHEDETDVKAYLSKLLGEEFYLVNNLESSFAYSMYSIANSKANAGNLSIEFLLKKALLTGVQESFALFHELAHSIIQIRPEEITKTENFMSENSQAKLIAEAIQEQLIKQNKNPDLKHFVEELTCDFISLKLVFEYNKDIKQMKSDLIIEGITLAFLYLRTLSDLRNKANNTFENSEDIFDLFKRLRYNLLRQYFQTEELFNKDRNYTDEIIVLYDKWEEKIDVPIFTFFDDKFNSELETKIKTVQGVSNHSGIVKGLLSLE